MAGDLRDQHWNDVWAHRTADQMSWHQEDPTISLQLIRQVTDPSDSIVDVGGGASRLVDHLLEAGYGDLTVIDIAAASLAAARARLGPASQKVSWLVGDVTALDLGRTFRLWHDRAVLHFLVDASDRHQYVDGLRRALDPGGWVVIAAFGPDGPERCSGLPVRRYDAQAMLETLGDEFHLVEHVDERHRTPSGDEQSFVYGLFQHRGGATT